MGAGLLIKRGLCVATASSGACSHWNPHRSLICCCTSAATFWRKAIVFLVTCEHFYTLLTCRRASKCSLLFVPNSERPLWTEQKWWRGGDGPGILLWYSENAKGWLFILAFCRLGTCLLLLSGFILKSSADAFLSPPGCQPLCPGSCWALKWTLSLHSAGELHSQNRAPQRPFQSLNRKLTWGKRSGRTMAAFSGHREDGDELSGFRFSVAYSHVEKRWWEKRREDESPFFLNFLKAWLFPLRVFWFSPPRLDVLFPPPHVSAIIAALFSFWNLMKHNVFFHVPGGSIEVTLQSTLPPVLTRIPRTPLCPATLLSYRRQRMHLPLLFVASFATVFNFY